jgi:hypothetical protein
MTFRADRRPFDVLAEAAASAEPSRYTPEQRIAALEGNVAGLQMRLQELSFEVSRLRQLLARRGNGGELA